MPVGADQLSMHAELPAALMRLRLAELQAMAKQAQSTSGLQDCTDASLQVTAVEPCCCRHARASNCQHCVQAKVQRSSAAVCHLAGQSSQVLLWLGRC